MILSSFPARLWDEAWRWSQVRNLLEIEELIYKTCNFSDSGLEKDPDVGLDYYLKGCDNEYMPACHNAALLLHSQKMASTEDPDRAVKLLQHACEQKHVDSCYQVKAVSFLSSTSRWCAFTVCLEVKTSLWFFSCFCFLKIFLWLY